MTPVEALTRMISHGEDTLKMNGTYGKENPELSDHEKELSLAVDVCRAMLLHVLPAARFHCFVEVQSGMAVNEAFTVSGLTIECLLHTLNLLKRERLPVRIILFELSPQGTSMVSGYQGTTKDPGFRLWLSGLPELNILPTVQ